jgi:hypothetical protein
MSPRHRPHAIPVRLDICVEGFGGMGDRFDLRIPPTGIENCLEVIYSETDFAIPIHCL